MLDTLCYLCVDSVFCVKLCDDEKEPWSLFSLQEVAVSLSVDNDRAESAACHCLILS